MMITNDLNLSVSPVFLRNHESFEDRRYKIIVNQGGTRSGKTYSLLQLLITIATRAINPLEISVVSHTIPHLKKGAIRDFTKIMQSLDLFDDHKFNKTEYIYKFSDKVYIEFFSADNGAKLRGPGRDILFVNEANLLTYDEWKQLIMRTRGKAIIDYNPVDEFHWIYDKILTRNDVKFIQSTYLDNYDYLPKEQIEEIERLKDEDPDYWRVYGLGEVAKSTNLIYQNFSMCDSIPNGDTIYGLDFGYNNPTALIEVTNYDNNIFLRQKIYDTKLTNSDLIELLKTFNIGNSFIYADSAEPQRIEEIYRAGFNIHPAEKNVKAGIDFCKRYKLHIDRHSSDLLKEIKSYKWKQDKNEQIIDEPVKFNDHILDAFRYATFTHGIKYWMNAISVFPDIAGKKERTSLRSKLKSL